MVVLPFLHLVFLHHFINIYGCDVNISQEEILDFNTKSNMNLPVLKRTSVLW